MDFAFKFWNDKKNILWFKSQPFSQYWVDFFSKIKNKKNKRVLDLGCGVGRNTKMLSKLGFNFYACDNCKKMVDETKKSLKNIGFDEKFLERRITQQSMDNLSYPSNYFDFIISHGVYHSASSMREFKKALKESCRILKVGGVICFNIFTSLYTRKDAMLKKVHQTYI